MKSFDINGRSGGGLGSVRKLRYWIRKRRSSSQLLARRTGR